MLRRTLLLSLLTLSLALPAAADETVWKTITEVAVGSKDHTTLVAALTAANYADSLKNAGPFTVFAPTNAAFAKLPPGTVETLVKPENVATLKKILQHHVMVSVYEAKWFKEGQSVGMADGTKATMHVKDGKVFFEGAEIIASIRCSNGIIHVVDGVVTPPEKK